MSRGATRRLRRGLGRRQRTPFPRSARGVLGCFEARRHGDVLGVHPGEELLVFSSPLTKEWVQELVLAAVVNVQEPEKLAEVVRKA